MSTLVVVVLKDNMVQTITEHSNVKAQETNFFEACASYGVRNPGNADFENGYMEFNNGYTVCITSTTIL